MQRKTNTFIPEFFYVNDDYARGNMIVNHLLREEGQGNMIIYVNPTSGEQRLNNLVKFLHGEGFDRRVDTLVDFTTSFNPTILADQRNRRQILIVTRDDM
jgi:hypothetical protein